MMKRFFCSLLLCIPLTVCALESDRNQPIEINADNFDGDEVKQNAVYSGRVVVTQGSMQLSGERLELRLSSKGYRQAFLTAAPKDVARFKQQRDARRKGVDEWYHASAQRIIYDEETDLITLEGNARLIRSENGKDKDVTEGDRIVYNMRNARSSVEGRVSSGQRERVTTIIAPRAKPDEASTKTRLSPVQSINNKGQK